jgi:hypothetical protein
MISIGGILFGLFFIAFGISCVKWNYVVANNLREFDFLATMGGGDIYNGVKVFGIICILLGLTIGLGLWQGLLSIISEPFGGLIQ